MNDKLIEAADALLEAVNLERIARAEWEDAYDDREGAHGPKGRALAKWQALRAELYIAITAYRTARGE